MPGEPIARLRLYRRSGKRSVIWHENAPAAIAGKRASRPKTHPDRRTSPRKSPYPCASSSLVLVLLLWHLRRLDLDLGFREHILVLSVEFERSHGYNALSALQALRDVRVQTITNSDFDLFSMRHIIGVECEDGDSSVRGRQQSCDWDDNCLRHRLARHCHPRV